MLAVFLLPNSQLTVSCISKNLYCTLENCTSVQLYVFSAHCTSVHLCMFNAHCTSVQLYTSFRTLCSCCHCTTADFVVYSETRMKSAPIRRKMSPLPEFVSSPAPLNAIAPLLIAPLHQIYIYFYFNIVFRCPRFLKIEHDS